MTTRTVSGQSGDASHLRLQVEILKELNKLGNHYPVEVKRLEHDLNLPMGLGGMSLDKIVAAKVAMDEMRLSGNGKPKVLDVSSNPVEGNGDGE